MTELTINMWSQEQTNWCWAAVSTSVALYYNEKSHWRQCIIVNTQLAQTTCCVKGDTKACDQPSSLTTALTTTGNLNKMTPSSISLSAVNTEINAKRPIGARIDWGDGSAHVMAITGSLVNDIVQIKDPFSGETKMSYTQFRDNYQGSGTWSHSYTTKA
ncbi:MAG: papain-like cysteine protease family protein [Rhodospirillales bacterium]